ncbi:MAG: formate dehydrogenase subunit delta [Alphaproteobacteria bacterium]
MSPDKMIHMANQIAAFFAAQQGDPVALTADHIAKFWDPRMRRQLIDHVAAGGTGLTPIAENAARTLTAPT